MALSTDLIVTPNSEIEGEKSSEEAFPLFSTKPNELFETPIILTSVFICVISKALFVKAVRFTVKGEVLEGEAITLDA